MISFRELAIGYDNKVVLEGISEEIAEGQVVCLVGRNGAGKSTLLRSIAGLHSVLSGEIVINGHNLKEYSRKELARTVGIVQTERTMLADMSVEELVSLGRSPYTGFFGALSREDKAVVDESLESVKMESFRKRMVSTLSDGERQKVMIARALAQQTPIILMDEPTAFLDFTSKVDLFQMLISLAHSQKKTIIVSTHDINLALRLSDEMILITNDNKFIAHPTDENITEFIGEEASKYL